MFPRMFIEDMDSDNPTTIFTVGHSNITEDEFIRILRENGIETILDVRSSPYSKYATQFNYKEIQSLLEREGIGYVYLGDSMGGKPRDPALMKNGRPDYDAVRTTDSFRKGIQIAKTLATGSRAALMCAEEDPARCHRTILDSPALEELGLRVLHIRHSGPPETQREALARRPAKERQTSFEF